MLKLWVRNTLLFFAVIIISVFAGWCAYTVTKNMQKEEYAAKVSATGAQQQDSASSGDVPVKSAEFQYYTVCLENEKINVYGARDGREEFLYSVDIYTPDLPESDRSLLEEGVRLEDSSGLTAFLENYTS